MDRNELLKLKKMNKEIFREIMNTCMKINNEIVTIKEYSKSDPSNPIFKVEEDKLIDRYHKVIELLFIMDDSIDYQLNKKEDNKDE
jgi:hypothetical protein